MKTILVAATLLVASALAGVAQPQQARSADPAGKTITVTGSGSIETVPDRATFSFGVITKADTAKAALARNGDLADAVLAALKGAKVQTSAVMLDPRLDDAGSVILGYTATTFVTADTGLDRAGALIDAAVAAGATSVSGPGYARSDRDALYRQALAKAVADAHAKAAALAAATGATLGEARTVSEGGGGPVPVPYERAAGTTIEPGTQSVEASVTVTYAAT
jgi:uncharacterized protein YggE